MELTPKEIAVSRGVWQAKTNPEIASELGMSSEQIVKNHLRNVFDKLGVWTRLELALYIENHGGAEWMKETA